MPRPIRARSSAGSQGFGTGPHLLTEMFKLETGVNIVHVPYRGTAPVLAAILAGEIQMVFGSPAPRSCRTSRAASCAPLAVPTRRAHCEIAGSADHGGGGLSEDAAPFWLGVVAPAGTPPAIVDKLNAAFRESLAPPETRDAADEPRRRHRDRHAGRSSARCSPTSWRSGPPSPRPPTSEWIERLSEDRVVGGMPGHPADARDAAGR